MPKNIKRNEEGFTIIEVLIVLAIAGIIMVIVFLAVPALQRNARNTQRTNDAALVVAGVNECMANRNGVLTQCRTAAQVGQFVDFSRLNQLNNYDVRSDNSPSPNTGHVRLHAHTSSYYGNECNDAGSAVQYVSGSGRQFAVTYRAETTGGGVVRCIDG